MKKIVLGIFVMLMNLIIATSNVYATNDENTTENSTTQETVAEEKKEENPTEVKKNETMYVQERCNIRSSYSVESSRVGGLDAGTEVTVIAEYSNGWYKIKYDGGEAYIKAGILRSTKPEIEETEITEKTSSEVEDTESPNQEKDEKSTTTDLNANKNDEVDIRDAELINEIGVLPEVGKNIADYLYIGVISLSVCFVIYIKYKFRKEELL